jgi:hypothetical protein
MKDSYHMNKENKAIIKKSLDPLFTDAEKGSGAGSGGDLTW